MKKLIIFIMLIVCSSTYLYSQKKPKIEGDKEVVQSIGKISEPYSALEIKDGLEVVLKNGPENSYILNADSNLVHFVHFEVEDGTLRVFTSMKFKSFKKVEIILFANSLEWVSLLDDAQLRTDATYESQKLALNADSSSRFDLNLKADEIMITLKENAGGKLVAESRETRLVLGDRSDLKVENSSEKLHIRLNDSAELRIKGNAEYADFGLQRSAELDAQKLQLGSAEVQLANSADLHVNASKNLLVSVEDKSKIYIYGSPKLEIKNLSDKSSIIKKKG